MTFLPALVRLVLTRFRWIFATGGARDAEILALRHQLLVPPTRQAAVIWNRCQLERLIVDYIQHYNEHRPHRSLDQRPPLSQDEDAASAPPAPVQVIRSTRCNGLVNEYRNAA